MNAKFIAIINKIIIMHSVDQSRLRKSEDISVRNMSAISGTHAANRVHAFEQTAKHPLSHEAEIRKA